MPPSDEKRVLRARLRARRRSLAPDVRTRAARDVCAKLLARPEVAAALRARAPIAVYCAAPEELDLTPFVGAVRLRGGLLCAPRWNGSTYTLARLDPCALRAGPHGIPEPRDDDPIAPEAVAVWIAPGLGFTVEGGRLGYGGGWYDRFFAAADPASARLGAAFGFQVRAALPLEAHDRALTDVVTAPESAAIGFFDSGVGGLSVWRAVRELLPAESTDYIGDDAFCPYGARPTAEILARARHLTRTLLARGAKLVTVACNTATAAAIDALRAEFPSTPFVGMEPAVKPAALHSKTGVVGVLATAGTFHGRLYRETAARFAAGTNILATVADEFVTLVERGETDGPAAEVAVRARVEPLLAAGADHLVLGCTHFPFLKPLVERVAAGRAVTLDPAPAVARQVARLLAARAALASAGAPVRTDFETTGDAAAFDRFLENVLP